MPENLVLNLLRLAGEDALTNHFNMIIPAFPNALAVASLNLRILTVEIPAQTLSTYTITKRGKTFERPGGVSEQGNEFTFTYRVDKYFQTYQAISQWLGFIKSPTTGAMASDSGPGGLAGVSEFRVPIVINGLDANNMITGVWTMTGCFPKSQDAISFDESTGDPIEGSVTMSYVDIFYPGDVV